MILLAAEARIVLGMAGDITAVDRALIEFLLPQVQEAVATHLRYDPEYRERTREYYPRVEGAGATGYVEDSNGIEAFLRPLGGTGILQLAALPVRKVTDVRVDHDGRFGQRDGSFGDDSVWTAGDDYYLDSDQDVLLPNSEELGQFSRTGHLVTSRSWPAQPGTVRVSYFAGYSQDELNGRAASGISAAGIKKAALLIFQKSFSAAKLRQKNSRVGFKAGVVSESMGSYSYSLDSATVAELVGMKIEVPPEAADALEKYVHWGTMAT